jgi:hypothetical protein
MLRQKLFFTAMIIGSMITNNCYPMEILAKPEPILLNNGLLTLVPSRRVNVGSNGMLFQEYYIKNIIKKTTPETLITLMGAQSARASVIGDYVCLDSFCPTIVLVKDNTLTNCGTFSKMTHKEVKEACRFNKGAFYDYKQCAILYSLEPFILAFTESKRIELEAMIDENAQKPLNLHVPLYASIP